MATLSPAGLTSAGFGTFGVLAVVAVLGFVGFEQAPVLAEEARSPRRTIPVATYFALGVAAIVYAGAGWAMAAHAGQAHVVAAAAQQGPGLLFGLGGSLLSQSAQVLFLTSLFAAALAFHNCVWRYMFALGREGVLPATLGRTGGNNIPKAASLTQSLTGLAVITAYAIGGWPPMTDLFFWLGTTGGFGILILLALTAFAVIAFFARDARGENTWRRLTAPALAAVLLSGIVVLAVAHYSTLLGVRPGAVAAWALPASYAAVAVIGLAWGDRRPTGPWTGQFLAFDAALERHHPAGVAHHHLAILAVRPDIQGQGIGTALLRAYHAMLDHDGGTPAYLEASDLRTRQLYLAHGYTGHGPPIHLPGGPRMYPMWRRGHT